MPSFYFTYGTSEKFPFQNGWTRVVTDNLQSAISLFRAAHPDVTPGLVNCSFVYDQEGFEKTTMYKNGNNGYKEHELITMVVDRTT